MTNFRGAAGAAIAMLLATGAGPAAAQMSLQSPFETPPGSWRDTCMGGMMMSGELIATCRNGQGFHGQSRIRVADCGGRPIANDNGRLVCTPSTGRDGGRRGRGGSRIVVYEHINFEGASRTFEGEIASMGAFRFNDVISSMEIRGAWEVCTDANFLGRCEVYRNDVSTLTPLGLNDVISSLRPVRR